MPRNGRSRPAQAAPPTSSKAKFTPHTHRPLISTLEQFDAVIASITEELLTAGMVASSEHEAIELVTEQGMALMFERYTVTGEVAREIAQLTLIQDVEADIAANPGLTEEQYADRAVARIRRERQVQ
jgi:hypothetical protein